LTVDCKIYKISIIKQGKFEYIKGIIRSRKSKKDRHIHVNLPKLRKDGVHITSDEQTNQVECEGTEAQVATARQVQQAKYMTEVHLGMVQQSTGGINRKIACDEMTEDDVNQRRTDTYM
jgi:hypothetical protein